MLICSLLAPFPFGPYLFRVSLCDIFLSPATLCLDRRRLCVPRSTLPDSQSRNVTHQITTVAGPGLVKPRWARLRQGRSNPGLRRTFLAFRVPSEGRVLTWSLCFPRAPTDCYPTRWREEKWFRLCRNTHGKPPPASRSGNSVIFFSTSQR